PTPCSGLVRKGLALSTRKSERVTLHSTSTEWQARFHPIASGISPLTQACSERTTPQRERRNQRTALSTSWAWVIVLGSRPGKRQGHLYPKKQICGSDRLASSGCPRLQGL